MRSRLKEGRVATALYLAASGGWHKACAPRARSAAIMMTRQALPLRQFQDRYRFELRQFVLRQFTVRAAA